MSKLVFSSEEEALQYFADITGQNIIVSGLWTDIWTSLAEKSGLIEKEYATIKRCVVNLEESLEDLSQVILDNKVPFNHSGGIGDIASNLISGIKSKSLSDIEGFLNSIDKLISRKDGYSKDMGKIIDEAENRIGVKEIKNALNKAIDSYNKFKNELKNIHPAIQESIGIKDIADEVAQSLIGNILMPALKSLRHTSDVMSVN